MSDLNSALAHYRLAADLPEPDLEPGSRWRHYRARLRAEIAGFDSAAAAILAAQAHHGFDHRQPTTAERIKYQHDMLRTAYPALAGHVASFFDSPMAPPATLVPSEAVYPGVKGRCYSNISVFHSFYVLTCLSYATAVRDVLEIGGGYGGPARHWLTNPISPIASYTLVDFPEALFFAELYLKAHFPEARHVYVTEAGSDLAAGRAGDGRRTIRYLPLGRLDMVPEMPCDLAVNTGAIQEMPSPWVDLYRAQLDLTRARYFYSHNYALTPINLVGERQNLFGPRVSADWSPQFVRFQHPVNATQSIRPAAEILFARRKVDRVALLEAQLALCENAGSSFDSVVNLMYLADGALSAEQFDRVIACTIRLARHLPTELVFLARQFRQMASQGGVAIPADLARRLDAMEAHAETYGADPVY